MPTLLTKNAKIRKSGKKHDIQLWNFGITAYKTRDGKITCPAAGICAKENGCYAQQGAYRFSNVAAVYEWRYTQTTLEEFPQLMQLEINEIVRKASKKNTQVVIRIHDSGDFYALNYWRKWKQIMEANPNIRFYAYTKMVRFFRAITVPQNFKLIFSEGGLFDKEIDRSKPHSRVFGSREELLAAGYVDASEDDLVAGLGDSPNIGLIYHGAPSKAWTTNET